jgi:hypothetical protein
LCCKRLKKKKKIQQQQHALKTSHEEEEEEETEFNQQVNQQFLLCFKSTGGKGFDWTTKNKTLLLSGKHFLLFCQPFVWLLFLSSFPQLTTLDFSEFKKNERR